MFAKLKLRLWHFLFLPQNVAGIKNGKKELSTIADQIKQAEMVYLVYQYGKSGSSTVYNYLFSKSQAVFHCHHLNIDNLNRTDGLYGHPDIPGKVMGQKVFSNARYRAYVNCLENCGPELRIFISLREPVGYLKSLFFQQWSLFSNLTKRKFSELTPRSYTQYFNDCMDFLANSNDVFDSQLSVNQFVKKDDIDIGVRIMADFISSYKFWFETELFEVFGLSHEDIKYRDGFWEFGEQKIKGVIVKLEDFNHGLHTALSTLTGDSVILDFGNKNVSAEKNNYEYYEYLKENASIPDKLLRNIKEGFSYSFFYNE